MKRSSSSASPARLADADRRHRPAPRLAVRASRRGRILPAGDRRFGHRDRAGADARMVRAARRAVEPRRGALRDHLPRRSRSSPSPRSSFRRSTGSRCSRSGSTECTETLAPVLDLYSNLEKFIDRTVSQIVGRRRPRQRTVRIETPNSLLGLITASAPHAAIQLFFALLVIYFFLAGWTGDAQAHDHQPRQLRGRDDDRAGDPAGGRRDLDLYRHDHRHQRRLGRADRADPVAARHGFAVDVGRHRRGAQLHPLSRPDRSRRCCLRSAG